MDAASSPKNVNHIKLRIPKSTNIIANHACVPEIVMLGTGNRGLYANYSATGVKLIIPILGQHEFSTH